MRYKAIMAVAVLLAVSALFVVPSDGSDAASPVIEVKDGLGNEFTFDGPVEQVMTIGKGITATVMDIGQIDKIVVCDSYSKTDSDTFFDPLRALIDDGKIAAGGNIYSSGKAQLQNDMINAADPETGVFDMERDVVFIIVSPSYGGDTVQYLKDKGFRNVMQWYDIKDYSEVTGFAETISKVCTGKVASEVEQMSYVQEKIDGKLSSVVESEKKKAFYVTYSGSAFKVGNTGSLATSMILAAGGNVVTIDPSKSGTTYETNLTKLVEDNPGVVIFVDNTVAKDTSRMDELRKQVGDTQLVPLKAIWNNYCIQSMNGVWTMACAMYPDLFEGDVPSIPVEESNTLVYIGAVIVVVAIIAVVAVVFMRKSA